MSDRIQQLAIELGLQLVQREWKLAAAESCTGGGLSYWITSLPGSSAWFERGFITYSNLSKEELLRVSSNTLSTFGSVSETTAREMAEGALQQSAAEVSIAITGIAGPDGGSKEKPIGTVWIACANIHGKTIANAHLFPGDRQQIREASIIAALDQLIRFVI